MPEHAQQRHDGDEQSQRTTKPGTCRTVRCRSPQRRSRVCSEIRDSLGHPLRPDTDGGHRRAVDVIVTRAHDWLVLHSDTVMDAV
ncbi:hypothetical protein ACWEGV_22090, partial [Streptomyces sp. NPDC004976]